MQPTPSFPQASAVEVSSGGEAAEHQGDWAEAIAFIVAATVEPSCAFSFCFAKQRVVGKDGADTNPQTQLK